MSIYLPKSTAPIEMALGGPAMTQPPSAAALEAARKIIRRVDSCAGDVMLLAESVAHDIDAFATQAVAAADDPEMDATDDAHPAWWRGDDHGCRVTVQRLAEALDGKDAGRGVVGYEPLETLRRRLIALAAERAKPAASDLESVTRGICKASGLCKYVGDKCNTSRCSVSPDAVATALAERGERERERAAFTAEQFSFTEPRLHPDVTWADTSENARYIAHLTAQLIAAAIRKASCPP